MHRDVACAGVVLQPVEHGEAGMVRQPHVEDHRMRQILPRRQHPVIGGRGDDALEAELMGEIEQDAGEGEVVLHHQDQPRARERERVSSSMPAGAGRAGRVGRDGGWGDRARVPGCGGGARSGWAAAAPALSTPRR